MCALALFTLLSPGCTSTTPGGPISSACPPGTTCQTKLTIFHTSDIHSRLLPFDQLITQIDAGLGLGNVGEVRNIGGVSRLAYVLGRERARAGRSLHLDSGDCFQGAPIFNFFAGEPEVRAQSLLGSDAVALGNHEFDRGALNITQQFNRWANFPLLAANYNFDDPSLPASPKLGTVARPFTVLNADGLKVAVIGMGNLSSLTSIFDQPNRSGIQPLNTVETAQFYIDLLRPYVDVVILLTHLGLDVDERMIRGTTGADIVLGGHNHIVLNPPQIVRDCSADPSNPGYVWTVDPNKKITPGQASEGSSHDDFYFQRPCVPRNVVLAHSGAFAKYLGRLDLQLSNDPALVSPTGNADDYDSVNGFEVLSSEYIALPMNDTTPTDPIMERMLEPYRLQLDVLADLDTIVGYAPGSVRRVATNGGDSPLGNTIATAAWLRLGIQTDFSLTNTTGIRADINPGPLTIEADYNVFPFDNSITKMQLSGLEVQELFDFVARRSANRGCNAQAQIAGARVKLHCSRCIGHEGKACKTSEDCEGQTCNLDTGKCRLDACAEEVYIGNLQDKSCTLQGDPGDAECAGEGEPAHSGQCPPHADGQTVRCLSRVNPTNLYELATSNYLAGGGSGYRVLQRNTTQFDTRVQQRDALIDYIRQGKPCGFSDTVAEDETRTKGLRDCYKDADCTKLGGDFVCAATGKVHRDISTSAYSCATGEDDKTTSWEGTAGQCVLRACRNSLAEFEERRCASAPDRADCQSKLNACSLGGESCKILACVDVTLGAATDNRLEMQP